MCCLRSVLFVCPICLSAELPRKWWTNIREIFMKAGSGTRNSRLDLEGMIWIRRTDVDPDPAIFFTDIFIEPSRFTDTASWRQKSHTASWTHICSFSEWSATHNQFSGRPTSICTRSVNSLLLTQSKMKWLLLGCAIVVRPNGQDYHWTVNRVIQCTVCIWKVDAVWCVSCTCRAWLGCCLKYELRDAGTLMR